MTVLLKNNAFGFLASAISATDVSITLQAGNGASFPAIGSGEYFYATIQPTSGGVEIVKVTGRANDVLTVVRAQEGTSAFSFAAGSRVELRVTAQSVIDAITDRVAGKDQASEIGFIPYANIAATNVQAAIQEEVDDLASSAGSTLVGYINGKANGTSRLLRDKLNDFVCVLDFIPSSLHASIADGTCTTDVQPYIQNALSTFDLRGGTLWFPVGIYPVADTINIGFWSINGTNGNIQGFAGAKTGFKMIGETRQTSSQQTALIKWIGPLQLGDNAVTNTDSVGSYTFITNDKPVINVVAGWGHHYEGISIDGDNKAHAGFQYEGNGGNITFFNASIRGCRVGIRMEKQVRHDTYAQYWGYADSPYYKANVYNAPAVGGFADDTTAFRNLFIQNCGVGVSLESAQLLAFTMDNVWIANTAASMPNWSPIAGIINIGGRVNLRGVGVGGDMTYGIWHVSNSSTIEVQEFHDESTSAYTYQGSTVPGGYGRINFHNGDMKGVNFPSGEGVATFTNVLMGGPILRTGDNSGSGRRFLVSLRDVTSSYNGSLIQLGTVADRSMVQVTADNVNFSNSGNLINADYGEFIGRVGQTTPKGPYDWYEGRANTVSWRVERTRQLNEFNGYDNSFCGIKTGIADQTPTVIGKFTPSTSDFFAVELLVLMQNGPSSNVGAMLKKLAFVLGKSSAGTYFASAVSEIDSLVAGNLASFTATFTLNIVADGVELIVDQDNEVFDQPMTLTLTGKYVGGYDGGRASNLFTFA